MDVMQTMWAEFHFLRPWALSLFVVLFALMYLMQQSKQAWGAWSKICSPELLDYLQVGSGVVKQSRMPVLALAWVGMVLIVALAGPVWKKIPQPVYQSDSALVVVLDLSLSMDAEDLKPSRLQRAKQKITDLLRLRQDGQTALIVFAGTAHVVTPLTDDVATIASQLRELSTDIMPEQGGNMDAAVVKALALLKQSGVAHGVVLMLTDSNQFSDAVVKTLVQAGHRLNVIGIGTQEGAPIPQASGGFLTDGQGNIVMPKLDEERLQTLAALGHGQYHRLSLQQDDLNPVLAQLKPSAWQDAKVQKTSQAYDTWYEEGSWLVLLAIPFVLMAFRRGVLLVILIVGLHSSPVQAFEWENMWQTPQAKGESLMQEKKYSQAAQQLERDDWQAAAHYRAKDYAAAVNDFQHIAHPTADDVYNQGNALAHLGKLDAAIAAYDKALKMNPKLSDAKANKALLEKLKKQGKQKQNNQHQKSSKDGKKGKQSDKPSQTSSQDGKSKQDDGKASDSKQKSSKQQTPQKKTAQANQGAQGEKKDKKSSDVKKNKEKSVASRQNSKQDMKKRQTRHALSQEELKKLEKQQAFEQNMRRIPDDPGGLLRRKFMYQYQQQHPQGRSGGVAW